MFSCIRERLEDSDAPECMKTRPLPDHRQLCRSRIMGFAGIHYAENTMWKSAALVQAWGGMFGAILAVAGRALAVHTDPRIEEITNLLPGANCGSCGYPGCGGLAALIVAAGRDGVSPCLACSPDSKAKKIARIMGFTGDIPLSPDLTVARVACKRLQRKMRPSCTIIPASKTATW